MRAPGSDTGRHPPVDTRRAAAHPGSGPDPGPTRPSTYARRRRIAARPAAVRRFDRRHRAQALHQPLAEKVGCDRPANHHPQPVWGSEDPTDVGSHRRRPGSRRYPPVADPVDGPGRAGSADGHAGRAAEPTGAVGPRCGDLLAPARCGRRAMPAGGSDALASIQMVESSTWTYRLTAVSPPANRDHAHGHFAGATAASLQG